MDLEEATSICGELIDALRTRANKLVKLSPNREFTVWTAAIKAILEEIGSRAPYGYDCLYSSKDKDLHEFLLDFVWWDKEKKMMVLACESEFGNTRSSAYNPYRVAEDFDKLLSVKASFKLMVFDSYEGTLARILQELNQHLLEFGQHEAGEIYMLLDTCKFDDLDRERIWQCTIQKSGHDSSLQFSKV